MANFITSRYLSDNFIRQISHGISTSLSIRIAIPRCAVKAPFQPRIELMSEERNDDDNTYNQELFSLHYFKYSLLLGFSGTRNKYNRRVNNPRVQPRNNAFAID